MNIVLAVFPATGLYMVEFPKMASAVERPRIGYIKRIRPPDALD